jgi:hypothetical protein
MKDLVNKNNYDVDVNGAPGPGVKSPATDASVFERHSLPQAHPKSERAFYAAAIQFPIQ